ncbi:MAG: DUF3426 domain-containing protein [Rhodocyclaceae bacterium]|nr:DUF3426 domain-containing protein [Rhodocyclaceae bacterium]
MLTRCPACQTTFKVTPEQLKLRAGKVRCGKCQSVFNALDSLADAPTGTPSPAATQQPSSPTTRPSTPPPQPLAPPARPVTSGTQALTNAPAAERTAAPAAAPIASPATPPASQAPAAPLTPPVASALQPTGQNAVVEQIDLQPIGEIAPAASPASAPIDHAGSAEAAPAETPANPDEVRDAAITHGLVAARETTEIPGYNKWAEGAFTAPANITVPVSRPRWPFVLVSVLLIAALAGQAAHHYRAELAVSAPSLRPLLDSMCAALECDIPLPRHAEFVSIEASDLQSDAARGGALVLAATLKNRAPYAQAWPLLEVTLTDVQDNAVLRRVLQAADYLPAKADPTVFPPNAEIAVKLWLETQDVAAAGYRLYVFYP